MITANGILISFLKDFTFNLNELQVLPEEGRPIGGWSTPEKAFNNIAAGVRKVIISIKNNLERQDLTNETEKRRGTIRRNYAGKKTISKLLFSINSNEQIITDGKSDGLIFNASEFRKLTKSIKSYLN